MTLPTPEERAQYLRTRIDHHALAADDLLDKSADGSWQPDRRLVFAQRAQAHATMANVLMLELVAIENRQHVEQMDRTTRAQRAAAARSRGPG